MSLIGRFWVSPEDLLVHRNSYRLYVEIKRENLGEDRRLKRIQEVSGIINAKLDEALRPWLRQNELRLEIMLTSLFSNPHAQKIVSEILARVPKSGISTGVELTCLRGSKIIVLPQNADVFYRKGLHSGIVRVEVAGTPVPLFAPSSTPVRTTFGLQPNLSALGERIRIAGKQLDRDLRRDAQAEGIIVMECMSNADSVVEAIQKRFWHRLPDRCWGVTLISPRGWVIPRSNLTAEQIDILKFAAQDVK